MKTSLLLSILLIFNTAAIFIEPITQYIQSLNSLYFIGSEFILVIGYSINRFYTNIRNSSSIDFNNLGFYPKQNK